MSIKKDGLPVGVYKDKQQKGKYVAAYSNRRAGVEPLKKYFNTLDEAINQRNVWEKKYGKTKSRPRNQDLVGKKFYKLTVIKEDDKIGRHTTWLCKCDCGNTISATTGNLKAGLVRSCGKCNDTNPYDPKYEGVYLLNNNKFRATFTYRGKQKVKNGFADPKDAYYNGRLDLENILKYNSDEHELYMYYLKVKKYIEIYATDEQMDEFQKLFDKREVKSKKKED